LPPLTLRTFTSSGPDCTRGDPPRKRGNVDVPFGGLDRPPQHDANFWPRVLRPCRTASCEQGEPRVQRAVDQIDAPVCAEVGALRAHRGIAQPCLALADRDLALGGGNAEAAARERRIHAVAYPDRVDGQPLIDRTHDIVESRRVEPRQPRTFEGETAGPGKRPRKRNC